MPERWVIEVGGRARQWRRLGCAIGTEPIKHELAGWQELSGIVRATSPDDGRVQIVWAQAGRYRITYLT
jgi:hypothetical protein